MPRQVAEGACRTVQNTVRKGSHFSIIRDYFLPSDPEAYWSVRRVFDDGLLASLKTRAGVSMAFTPRDPQALIQALRPYLKKKNPALLGHLEKSLAPAVNDMTRRSQQYFNASQLIDGLRSRLAVWMAPKDREMMGFITSYTPVSKLLAASAEDLTKGQKIAAFRRALSEHLDEGIGMANAADPAHFGQASFSEGKNKAIAWANDPRLSDVRVEDLLDAWTLQRDYYLKSRTTAVKNYRGSFPDTTFTDDEIAEALGLGPTLDAYFGHVLDLSNRSGMGTDPGLMAAIADGGWETSFTGAGSGTLAGTLRHILDTPVPRGQTRDQAREAAFRQVFPGLKWAEHSQTVERAALAADDVRMYMALPHQIKNRYLLRRKGDTMYTSDWLVQFEATSRAAARHDILAPTFEVGGRMHTLIRDWKALDPSTGGAFADALGQVAGINPMRDGALRDVAEYGYGLTGAAYHAIALGWPGISIPNILGLPLYALGEAVRPGFKEGAMDTVVAMKLFADPGFRNWLNKVGLNATYAHSPTAEGFRELTSRMWSAWQQKDPAMAFKAAKELGMSWSDFIAISEAHFVKPFAYGLGLARHMREKGLVGKPWAEVSQAGVEDMMDSMMNVAAKLTIIPGAVNVMPAMRLLHSTPVIGPMMTMFLSTPMNIAGYTYRNLKTVVDPRTFATHTGGSRLALSNYVKDAAGLAEKAQALRVFSMTSFAGTMIAGPYWFFPWFREMGTTQDREELIGVLNGIEKNFSLAGLLNIDLARRLSPASGPFERFFGTPAGSGGEAVARTLLGPLGPAAADIKNGIFGNDLYARRRALGVASEAFDIPATDVLPGAAQVLLPGATGINRLLEAVFDIPRTRDGFSLDPSGQIDRPVNTMGKAKAFIFGSRDLEDAVAMAEGKRTQARVEQRTVIERSMKAAILDGKIDRALDLWSANQGLGIHITLDEVQQSAIARQMPAEVRKQVWNAPLSDAIPRISVAFDRLANGGLSQKQRAVENWMAMAGLMKMKKGVRMGGDDLIGSSFDPSAAPTP